MRRPTGDPRESCRGPHYSPVLVAVVVKMLYHEGQVVLVVALTQVDASQEHRPFKVPGRQGARGSYTGLLLLAKMDLRPTHVRDEDPM